MVALSQVQTGQGIPLVLKDVSLPPPYPDSLPDYQVRTGQRISLVLKDVSLPPPYTDSLPGYQVSSDQGSPWYSRIFTSCPHTWKVSQTIR